MDKFKKIPSTQEYEKVINEYKNEIEELQKDKTKKKQLLITQKGLKNMIENKKRYAKVKNKIKFCDFTIDIMKTYYKNNKWTPIYLYAEQIDLWVLDIFGPEVKNKTNRKEIFTIVFFPDGGAEIGNKYIKDWVLKSNDMEDPLFAHKQLIKKKHVYITGFVMDLKNKEIYDGFGLCDNNRIAWNCMNTPLFVECEPKSS